jgi:type II secretory ATPase GspE/PulE/Tfp pilus assembly ATPase PilB-like protein
LANKKGCEHCIEGNSGMVPVHGLLTMNPTVRELLLSTDEKDWMKAQGASDSKYTLFDSAYKLFERGLIDLESVML